LTHSIYKINIQQKNEDYGKLLLTEFFIAVSEMSTYNFIIIMTKKQRILEQEKYQAARLLEQSGDTIKAINSYEKIIKKNPVHIDATSRLLILYRKQKKSIMEIELLENAIANHHAHIESSQREWISEHREMAERSRPIAKMLGLLNAKELPFYEHEILNRWKLRLERLKSRIQKSKNAKTKNRSKDKN